MPMWAQTCHTGKPYYREHKASRSHGLCPGGSGSITTTIIDEQISKLVEEIELGPQWLEEVLTIISLKDEVDQLNKKRQAVHEKLLEMELESLVVPQANAAEEAGKLIMDLPRLWGKANLEERRKLLLTMLEAVYIDARKAKSIVAIKPKPPFKPVFQVAASKEGSDIRIENEPYKDSSLLLVETGESRSIPETMMEWLSAILSFHTISPKFAS